MQLPIPQLEEAAAPDNVIYLLRFHLLTSLRPCPGAYHSDDEAEIVAGATLLTGAASWVRVDFPLDGFPGHGVATLASVQTASFPGADRPKVPFATPFATPFACRRVVLDARTATSALCTAAATTCAVY